MRHIVEQALILAQEAPAGQRQPTAGESFLSMAPMFLFIAVLFYFLLIRPQQRERQRQDQVLKALKNNDRVVTVGGAVGTIVNITPDSKVVTLRVDDNTRMVFLRSAIQGPFTEKEEPAAKETAN
jgi:preprotein translocase subunit YajC